MKKFKSILSFVILILISACNTNPNTLSDSDGFVETLPFVSPTVRLTISPSPFPTETPTKTLTKILVLFNPTTTIDVDSAKDLMLLETFKGSTQSISFSQNSSFLSTTPWKGKIKLWNLSILKEMDTLVAAEPETQLFSRLEDQIFVVKTIGDEGAIWNLTSGEQLYSFTGHLFGQGPAVSSDGSLIAVSSASSDGEIHFPIYQDIVVWDLKSQKIIQTLYGDWVTDDPEGYPVPYNVFFSPDDSLLAAEMTDATSIVWDVASGERIKEFANESVLAFSYDGRMLVTRANGYQINIYDSSTWKLTNTSLHASTWITSVTFTQDNELLIVGSRDGNSTIWDWKTGEQIRELSPTGPQLLISPDGTMLASYDESGNCIYIWGVP